MLTNITWINRIYSNSIAISISVIIDSYNTTLNQKCNYANKLYFTAKY